MTSRATAAHKRDTLMKARRASLEARPPAPDGELAPVTLAKVAFLEGREEYALGRSRSPRAGLDG